MILGDLYYACAISVVAEQICLRSRTRILTDSARLRIRKEVLANNNKTRITIGHLHESWMEMKEALRVQTHAEVSTSVPLRM